MSRLCGLALVAGLAGCAPDYGIERLSRICVELPEGVALGMAMREQVTAKLDDVLVDGGYPRSVRGWDRADGWLHEWSIEEGTPGGNEPLNTVTMVYTTPPARFDGERCDLRLDIYGDTWQPQEELEWRTFFLLRDDVLPRLVPGSIIRVVEHPAYGTWAWDVPALAARFAPREPLPTEIEERVDAYESRSAVGRWLERTGASMSTTWKRTVGGHVLGVAVYFLFPIHWIFFLVFAAGAVAAGAVVRRRGLRTTTVVALAVVMLTPIEVPTIAGGLWVPQAYFLVTDFHVGHYFRHPTFTVVASLTTAVTAWLLLRLLRRIGVWMEALRQDLRESKT